MRIVEITNDFDHNGINYKKGHQMVMPEDIEGTLRTVRGNCLGLSHPFETIYRPYRGEDLTNKKIMMLRTGGVGDLHWLSPVVRYLKKRYAGCYIRVATACREPLMNLPEIDDLQKMPFNVKLMEDTDFQIFFQGIIESSNEQSKKTHAVDMFFSYFGIDSTQFPAEDKVPRIVYSEEELKWSSEEFKKLGVKDTDFVIGIQMETSAPLRNYPKEKFKVVIDILAKEDNVKIFLIGSAQQAPVAGFLKGNNPNVIPAITYDVRKSIILANRYNIIVAPDSFMVQTAGALGKPLIGLYGPFSSDVRMKYFKNSIALEPKVACSPCYKHDFRTCIKGFPSPCFSLIDPEDVLQAIDFQRSKFYGGHFNYIAPLHRSPDFSEIEQYFLSADKGLCFFGAYYSHPNMIRVDTNKFIKPDISDLNYPFEWGKYPFILFMNNIGYENGSVFNNSKNFVRPGGYFIVYHENCTELFFNELKKDLGKSLVPMYSKFDPVKRTCTLVGKKPF